jgi:hypothetical protein
VTGRDQPAARLRERDRCYVCGYRQDLRRDGTLGKHFYDARTGVVCKGSGVSVAESHRIAYGGELV